MTDSLACSFRRLMTRHVAPSFDSDLQSRWPINPVAPVISSRQITSPPYKKKHAQLSRFFILHKYVSSRPPGAGRSPEDESAPIPDIAKMVSPALTTRDRWGCILKKRLLNDLPSNQRSPTTRLVGQFFEVSEQFRNTNRHEEILLVVFAPIFAQIGKIFTPHPV